MRPALPTTLTRSPPREGPHAATPQLFYCHGQRMAVGAVKAVIKLPNGKTVPPTDFFAAVGWDADRLRAACRQWDQVVQPLLEHEAALVRAADAIPASY